MIVTIEWLDEKFETIKKMQEEIDERIEQLKRQQLINYGAIAMINEMSSRELTIGLTLLVPTLIIGFWPRIAIDFYEASTNSLSEKLTANSLVALNQIHSFG